MSLKGSVLLLSGVALYKLFTSNSDPWKQITQVALTRKMEDKDVRLLVALMAKCDPISKDEEEMMEHPFVKFWMQLGENQDSHIVLSNVETMRRDGDFNKQVMRLVVNLQNEQFKATRLAGSLLPGYRF